MATGLAVSLLGAAALPYPIPVAKRVIRAMDAVIANHVAVYDWDAWSAIMKDYWTEDFVYDTVHGIGNFTGLRDWFDGEHVPFNIAFDQVGNLTRSRA